MGSDLDFFEILHTFAPDFADFLEYYSIYILVHIIVFVWEVNDFINAQLAALLAVYKSFYLFMHYYGRYLIGLAIFVWRFFRYIEGYERAVWRYTFFDFCERRLYAEAYSLIFIYASLLVTFSLSVETVCTPTFILLILLTFYYIILHAIVIRLSFGLGWRYRFAVTFSAWAIFSTKRTMTWAKWKYRVLDTYTEFLKTLNSILDNCGNITFRFVLPTRVLTDEEDWAFDPGYGDKGVYTWLLWTVNIWLQSLDFDNLEEPAYKPTISILAKNSKQFYVFNPKRYKAYDVLSLEELLKKHRSLLWPAEEDEEFNPHMCTWDSLFMAYKKVLNFKKTKKAHDAIGARDIRKLLESPFVYCATMVPYNLVIRYTTLKLLIIKNSILFYNFFKTTLVALMLTLLYFLYTIFFFKLQFVKQLAVWFVIGMLYFWLMSGFNFFVKRYQYGKFTSQIQRFWKRTNTYFWLIEGFLMGLFFFYFLNSSQEPLYMYDYSALNQEYLISLHTAGLNVVILSLVIYFMYFVLLRINSNNWSQINAYLLIISIFIFSSFFVETYQFYYIISMFNEYVWTFNEEDNMWVIDVENPILRTKHQYFIVCLIAKYWHFLFIFISWVFFLIKSFERRKVTYVLYGVNLQNLIILYVLNFACYLQWFKWFYRRFFDLPYNWFMTSIDSKFAFRLFHEMYLCLLNLLNLNDGVIYMYSLVHKSLIIWSVDSLAIWKYV